MILKDTGIIIIIIIITINNTIIVNYAAFSKSMDL